MDCKNNRNISENRKIYSDKSHRPHRLQNRSKKVLAAVTVMMLTIMTAALLTACSPQSNEMNSTAENKQDKTDVSRESDTGSLSTEPVSKDVFAMDTYMTLTAYGEGASEALDKAEKEILRIEELVSTGIKTSEISQINQEGEAHVSKDTEELILRSRELYKDTDGVFDISIYPVMKAWGFTDQNYRIPDQAELAGLLDLMGADGISVENGHMSVSKEGMQIDLGGIAKGYTSGRVMDIFRENGIEHAVISLGGNVQTLNDKPDGSSWRVAIENPENTSDYIGILEVKNKAVITSGGYERYFEENGKIYHHIIDPSTGYPADSGLTSVTIVSEDGTLADGLSTSLFIMGKEKAEAYWRKHADRFDVIFVEEDGTVSVSEGIADAFTSDNKWQTIGR